MRRVLAAWFLLSAVMVGQGRAAWRAATAGELQAVLPARAPVEKERIETEMRTATGIVNDRGQVDGAVVLITAGYAADGKYSHFLLLQAPMRLGDAIALPAGAYVLGWSRVPEGLMVHVFEAATGVERGSGVLAKLATGPLRVESFKIWAPGVAVVGERPVIQIGRFLLGYRVE